MARRVIVTVTLNASLDLTYTVDRIAPHESQRVQTVSARAGGKGINVARVLHALGRRALVTGFVGGRTGEAIRDDLATSGLSDVLVPIAANSRQTVTVVSTADGAATCFNEPGPRVRPDEWMGFLEVYEGMLAGASLVVLSGSLPRDVPPDAYALLAARAAEHRVPVVLDADGDALKLGVAGKPTLVKPNLNELRRAVYGTDRAEITHPQVAAEVLRTGGAGSVVVTLGEDGLVALTPEGCWRATPSEPVAGNPTGAGDAAVAALAVGLVDSQPWPDRLACAVALSAAAVRAPLAGSVDLDAYRQFLPAVNLEVL